MFGRRCCDDRVIYMIAARGLDYPTADTVTAVPLFTAALAEQGDCKHVRMIRPLLSVLAATDLDELQARYVECFDLNAKRALYLSYWTDGDTRRRGEVLARFKAAYRGAGACVDTNSELPDYLPVVLEFAAGDRSAGRELLNEYRASLELLRISLLDKWSHYAGAVAAVCATLPGASPADRASAMAMVRPPIELVGLDGYLGASPDSYGARL